MVKKKIHGNDYFYLRESKRINGKVKSIDLGYLGKSREEAEKKMKERLKKEPVQEIKMKKEILESTKINIDELANFCKRKGFVYPSGDIYGGFAGFWDFGHLGVELNNNLKNEWWRFHVSQRKDIVGIDGSIITHPQVWKASGHVDSFNDVFVVCKKCKRPGKVDRHELGKVKCECGGEYDKETAKDFELMFKTKVGATGEAYLRPETAQLIFTNFKFVQENARMKLPFGIAQIGKAFRNEIAPRDFLFRSREFEQMELQYFINPDKVDDCSYYEKIKNKKIKILTSKAQAKDNKEEVLTIDEILNKKIFRNKWHAYWLYNSYKWFLELGLNVDNLRLREHRKDELAHYARAAVDIEYKFNLEWRELFGSHDRGQFDIGEHEKFSKKNLRIFEEGSKEKILPRVIEASFGVGRAYIAFMLDSYYKNKYNDNVVLKLNPKLAPIKVAIFPIVKGKEYEKISKDIFNELKEEHNVIYDKSGSIGRRYARNDEIGTPFCITIDEKSLKSKDVTIRWRDTGEQMRIAKKDLRIFLREILDGNKKFFELGEIINTRKK